MHESLEYESFWDSPLLLRLLRVLCFVVILTWLGTFGYMMLEGWPVADGFYMTVITLSTVGYGETQPLSPEGRWFTTLLIFLSLVAMTWFTAVITSFIIESDLSGSFVRRKVLRMISNLKGHTIVCGSGSMAQAVVERLAKKKVSVVVIDEDEAQLSTIARRFRRVLTVVGSPTSDLVLAEANVLNATSVVAALENEVDNLLVSISCKDMGHDISVYARSNDFSIANRMRKAGVDEVISPSQLCGSHIAGLIVG